MVEITSMTFGYGKTPLFAELDLRLEPGSMYGLLGLNGAGKTSLLKLVAGALLPAGGRISAFGREPAKRSAAVLADLAFVAEDPWVPAVPLEGWLFRYAAFRPRFDRKRFDELVEEFGLDRAKSLSAYSYGQRKKFALASALASGARTVLLDEPSNGLDIHSKAQFRRVLASGAADDRVIVVSTHQVRDLESLIDPILILDGGKIVLNASAEELSARLSAERVASLEGLPVVYAEKDAMGWAALLAAPGTAPDLEFVFNATIAEPGRLKAALSGGPLGEYPAAASRTAPAREGGSL